MDSIVLQEIKFIGSHGVTEEERGEGAHFCAHLQLWLDLSKPGHTDDIHDTVDWRKLASTVTEVGETTSYKLVEKLAEVIVAEVLNLCPDGVKVQLQLEKTSAKLSGAPKGAMVIISRGPKGA